MKIGISWKQVLQEEFHKSYFLKLRDFLAKEQAIVYPERDKIFHAFMLTPFEDVNVVIVGQDPYHGEGQAEGLAFSVPPGIPHPPSLRNIFAELNADLQLPIPQSGSLLSWAKQGVFLLNTTLTVRAKTPLSHQGIGWELFTDSVIQKLWEREDPIVFVLWGKHAQDKMALLQGDRKHLILKAAHPSPFSAYRGFFGCKHFSQINLFLKSQGKKEIAWS